MNTLGIESGALRLSIENLQRSKSMPEIVAISWANHCAGIEAGDYERVFAVDESDPTDPRPIWYLYAQRGATIVQAETHRGQSRTWSSLDRLIGALRRGAPSFERL